MTGFTFPEHTWTILFYIGVTLFVFLNRKRFEIHGKIVALYRTQWGVRLMERVAARYPEAVKLLGYIGAGVGFVAMAVIVFFLLQGLYNLFFVEDALPVVSPVLPGIPVPGGIHIPLVQGVLSIFIVAVIHEFAHGVVASAHKVKVKNAGPAIFGPFFAAFVEPDEKQLKKKSDIVQYSMFAAGSFSNILLALVVFALLFFAVAPLMTSLYPAQGVVFDEVEAPAVDANVATGVRYVSLNEHQLTNTGSLLQALRTLSPEEEVVLIDGQGMQQNVVLGQHPEDAARPYLGVRGVSTAFAGQETIGFGVFQWFFSLLTLLIGLSLGIGLANLLPFGPLDGGRMFLLAMQQLYGEERGKTIWTVVSFSVLFLVLILLWPVFSSVFSGLIGLVSP